MTNTPETAPPIKPKSVPEKPKGVPTHRRKAIPKKTKAVATQPKEKRGRKADKIQAEQILQEVIFLITNFHSRQQIIQHCAKKWGIGDRQVDEYRTRAREVLRESVQVDREDAIAASLARLQEIRRMAKSKEDVRALIEAERVICKLMVPDRKEISGPDGGPIVTKDERPRIEITPSDWFAADAILKKARGEKPDGGETEEG